MYNNEESYIDKRIVRTKSKIKKTFLLLLQQKPYNKLTITEIVNQSKISRVTFYNHFDSKEELLIEIIDDVMKDLVISYRKPYENLNLFTVNDIKPSMLMLFEHVYKYSDFYSTVTNSDILIELQNRMIDELKNLALKDFSMINSNIDRVIYAEWYAYAIYGIILEWIKKGYSHSPKYMAEQLLDLVKSIPKKRVERKGMVRYS
ncbi:TetR/AcrR family transcriptional regulator [Oceanobacillus luteolus]|uniref:TetR/AcrR family transcriptional regulator n=1 Tax=Oceanobacillus luteolus TaxID=1274358 RepID=A0ABW4HRY0_9BACI|nr:TetR/AcrR family transcriptional regulator [Oceanobacillus luteolus]MCM3740364.1 TetR/AcrR family transcriptional regulator [Oceanobacillus luteolus]